MFGLDFFVNFKGFVAVQANFGDNVLDSGESLSQDSSCGKEDDDRLSLGGKRDAPATAFGDVLSSVAQAKVDDAELLIIASVVFIYFTKSDLERKKT